jgi:hypothetical protein
MSSITLVGTAVYQGTITFEVETDATVKPWVEVRCTKGDDLVYNAWHGFFPAYGPEPVFLLDSDWWQAAGGGAADGYARLVRFNRHGRDFTLAELEFLVEA